MENETLTEDQAKRMLPSWYEMAGKLRDLKAGEMHLRKLIFNSLFKSPKEGTNDYNLDDGYKLKGKHGLDRKVDEPVFTIMKDKLREGGINPDKLVVWKPELSIREYRLLTDEQRNLFDQCLTIKPSSPALEIVKPARRGKAK